MKINENMATCVAEVIQGQIAARIGEGYRVEVGRVKKKWEHSTWNNDGSCRWAKTHRQPSALSRGDGWERSIY